jgi:hypothetical protein
LSSYARGEVVEVLSFEEILATLDDDGTLDGMPFMPEMAAFCGRQFRVARRADRTCIEEIGEGKLKDTVFLEDVRCDGAAHDGCQRACLMFWNERWLRPPGDGRPSPPIDPTALSRLRVKSGDRYYCQSTELARIADTPHVGMVAGLATVIRDVRNRELSIPRFALILLRVAINIVRKAFGLGELGRLQGPGTETSKGTLDLKPGELVEVRPLSEIRETLDAEGKNKGLTFEPEMTIYKGPYEVDRRIDRIILEPTGEMRKLTHTVMLKGVNCQGLCARNCPRANPIYWREIWLRRYQAPS